MSESLEKYINRKRLFVRVQANVARELFIQKLNAAFPGARIGVGNPNSERGPVSQRVADCNYDSAAEATQAMRRNRFKLKVGNHDADITYQIERKDVVEKLAGEWGCRFMVVVKNLPPGEVSCAELCELFESVGEIFTIKILPGNRGEPYALVQYVEEHSVELSIQQINQQKLHGAVLYVERHLKARRPGAASIAGPPPAPVLPSPVPPPAPAQPASSNPPPGTAAAAVAGATPRAPTAAAALAAGLPSSGGSTAAQVLAGVAPAQQQAAAQTHGKTAAAAARAGPPQQQQQPTTGQPLSAAAIVAGGQIAAAVVAQQPNSVGAPAAAPPAPTPNISIPAPATTAPGSAALSPTLAQVVSPSLSTSNSLDNNNSLFSGQTFSMAAAGGKDSTSNTTGVGAASSFNGNGSNPGDSSHATRLGAFGSSDAGLLLTANSNNNSTQSSLLGGSSGGLAASQMPATLGLGSTGLGGVLTSGGLGLTLASSPTALSQPLLTPVLDLFSHLREPTQPQGSNGSAKGASDGGPVGANGNHGGALSNGNGIHAGLGSGFGASGLMGSSPPGLGPASGLLSPTAGSQPGGGAGAGLGAAPANSTASGGLGGGSAANRGLQSAPAAQASGGMGPLAGGGGGGGGGAAGGQVAGMGLPGAMHMGMQRISIRDSLRLALGRLEEMVTCPLTGDIMRDPVIAADGYSYDRSAIQAWLANHSRSPLSGEALTNKTLFPNRLAKEIIADILP